MIEVQLNKEDIKNLIPHREPMLLLDQVTLLPPLEAFSSYKVRGDEFFMQGHYPGNPIVPGNIQSEMLAQLGAVLVSYNSSDEEHPYHRLRKGKTPVIAALNNVRFKAPVQPGNTLELHITMTRDAGLIVNAEASASVDGNATVSEELTVAYI